MKNETQLTLFSKDLTPVCDWLGFIDFDQFTVETVGRMTDDTGEFIAQIIGYAMSASFRGESVIYEEKQGNVAQFYYDSTKSRRDDIGEAFDDFLFDWLPRVNEMLINGSPVRKRTTRHGKAGTRLIYGWGENAPAITRIKLNDTLPIAPTYETVANLGVLGKATAEHASKYAGILALAHAEKLGLGCSLLENGTTIMETSRNMTPK